MSSTTSTSDPWSIVASSSASSEEAGKITLGPAWMLGKKSQDTKDFNKIQPSTSSTQIDSQRHIYSKEKMLELFKPELPLPENFIHVQSITSVEPLEPVAWSKDDPLTSASQSSLLASPLLRARSLVGPGRGRGRGDRGDLRSSGDRSGTTTPNRWGPSPHTTPNRLTQSSSAVLSPASSPLKHSLDSSSYAEERDSRERYSGPSRHGLSHSFSSAGDEKRWLYKDQHGEIQGPFTDREMHLWHKAGIYFTPSLLLKTVNDVHFVPLASLEKKDGSSPFLREETSLLPAPILPIDTKSKLGTPIKSQQYPHHEGSPSIKSIFTSPPSDTGADTFAFPREKGGHPHDQRNDPSGVDRWTALGLKRTWSGPQTSLLDEPPISGARANSPLLAAIHSSSPGSPPKNSVLGAQPNQHPSLTPALEQPSLSGQGGVFGSYSNPNTSSFGADPSSHLFGSSQQQQQQFQNPWGRMTEVPSHSNPSPFDPSSANSLYIKPSSDAPLRRKEGVWSVDALERGHGSSDTHAASIQHSASPATSFPPQHAQHQIYPQHQQYPQQAPSPQSNPLARALPAQSSVWGLPSAEAPLSLKQIQEVEMTLKQHSAATAMPAQGQNRPAPASYPFSNIWTSSFPMIDVNTPGSGVPQVTPQGQPDAGPKFESFWDLNETPETSPTLSRQNEGFSSPSALVPRGILDEPSSSGNLAEKIEDAAPTPSVAPVEPAPSKGKKKKQAKEAAKLAAQKQAAAKQSQPTQQSHKKSSQSITQKAEKAAWEDNYSESEKKKTPETQPWGAPVQESKPNRPLSLKEIQEQEFKEKKQQEARMREETRKQQEFIASQAPSTWVETTAHSSAVPSVVIPPSVPKKTSKTLKEIQQEELLERQAKERATEESRYTEAIQVAKAPKTTWGWGNVAAAVPEVSVPIKSSSKPSLRDIQEQESSYRGSSNTSNSASNRSPTFASYDDFPMSPITQPTSVSAPTNSKKSGPSSYLIDQAGPNPWGTAQESSKPGPISLKEIQKQEAVSRKQSSSGTSTPSGSSTSLPVPAASQTAQRDSSPRDKKEAPKPTTPRGGSSASLKQPVPNTDFPALGSPAPKSQAATPNGKGKGGKELSNTWSSGGSFWDLPEETVSSIDSFPSLSSPQPKKPAAKQQGKQAPQPKANTPNYAAAATGGAQKKAKGKMQKVDPRLLGFAADSQDNY